MGNPNGHREWLPVYQIHFHENEFTFPRKDSEGDLGNSVEGTRPVKLRGREATVGETRKGVGSFSCNLFVSFSGIRKRSDRWPFVLWGPLSRMPYPTAIGRSLSTLEYSASQPLHFLSQQLHVVVLSIPCFCSVVRVFLLFYTDTVHAFPCSQLDFLFSVIGNNTKFVHPYPYGPMGDPNLGH